MQHISHSPQASLWPQIMQLSLSDKSKSEMVNQLITMLQNSPAEMKDLYYKTLYQSFLLVEKIHQPEDPVSPVLSQLCDWIDLFTEISNNFPEFDFLHDVAYQAAADFFGSEI